MTTIKPRSDELTRLTKDHLEEKSFGFSDGRVGFTHRGGTFGEIKIEDAINGNWIIRDRADGSVSEYESIDGLIDDGWVLD